MQINAVAVDAAIVAVVFKTGSISYFPRQYFKQEEGPPAPSLYNILKYLHNYTLEDSNFKTEET